MTTGGRNMPELPEVETITRQLVQKVKGLTIQNIEVANRKSFQGNPKNIIGAKITDIYRCAKNIIIDITDRGSKRIENYTRINQPIPSGYGLGLHMLIHLKMTGQLVFVDRKGQSGGGHPVPPFEDEVPNKYTRVSFDFSDGSRLYFNDIRKFGWIKILDSEELKVESEKLGPDPMASSFKLAEFQKRISKPQNKMVKPVLMDQTVIAGLGNIYAAEVCFRAGIMPNRKISTLKNIDYKNLFSAIKYVLPLAIKYKGTSSDAYVTLEGKKGNYASKLWVYGREGEPCPKSCGDKVQKMQLAGRGTYYCSNCQK